MTVPTKEEILAALKVPPEVDVIRDRNGRPNNNKAQQDLRVIVNRFQNLFAKEK